MLSYYPPDRQSKLYKRLEAILFEFNKLIRTNTHSPSFNEKLLDIKSELKDKKINEVSYLFLKFTFINDTLVFHPQNGKPTAITET